MMSDLPRDDRSAAEHNEGHPRDRAGMPSGSAPSRDEYRDISATNPPKQPLGALASEDSLAAQAQPPHLQSRGYSEGSAWSSSSASKRTHPVLRGSTSETSQPAEASLDATAPDFLRGLLAVAPTSSSRHDSADHVDRIARESELMLIIGRVRMAKSGDFLEERAEFLDVLEPGEQGEENVWDFVEEPRAAERVLGSRNSGQEGEEEDVILSVLPGVVPVGGRHDHLSLSTSAPTGHDSSPLTTGVEESSSSSGRRKNSFFSSDHSDSIPVSSSHVARSGASSFRSRSSFFSATPPRDVRSFFSHLDESVASRSVRGLNWLKLSSQQVLDIATDLATKLTAAVEVVLGEEKIFARHALHSYDVDLGDGSLRAALAANPSLFSNCWYRHAASYVLSLGWMTALGAREGGFFSWVVRWVLDNLPMGLTYGGFEPTVILSAQTTSLQLRLGGFFSWPRFDAFLRWVKAAPSDEATFHVSFTSPARRTISCSAGAQQTEEDDHEPSSKTPPATAWATQPPFNELIDVIGFYGREVASLRYVAARAEDPLTPRLEYILSGPSASSNVVGFFLLMDDIILPHIIFPFSVDGNKIVCDPTQAISAVFVRESLGGGSGDHGRVEPPEES